MGVWFNIKKIQQVGGYGGTKKRVPHVMAEGSADTAEKKTC